MSKPQVSRMAKSLDEMAEAFRARPLTNGPYARLWLDALTQKAGEGGRVAGISRAVAIAVNADGRREASGCGFVTTEDGAGWTAFPRGLVARGLAGARPVVSGAHPGLADAVASCLPGAVWQRRRARFARNLLSKVPKASQDTAARLRAPSSPGATWAWRRSPGRG